MAKFDTSKIPNFDALSTEEKLKAVMAFDLPDVDLSKYVSKETFDKKASEAAEYSRQLKEKRTEEENKAAEAEAKQKEIIEKYNALLEKTTISEYKAKYLTLGMDEKLAEATANAQYSGNTDVVFENISKLTKGIEEKVREDKVRGTGRPAGNGGKTEEGDDAGVAFAKKLGSSRSGEKEITEELQKYYK